MHTQEGYGTYFVVCVSVCEESTASEHRFYDKVSIVADCSLRFQDFQLTELSDVSFTSYRSFCSFFTVVAIFLNHALIWATMRGHAVPPFKRMHKADSIWSAPYATWCFLNLLHVRGLLLCSLQFLYLTEREVVSTKICPQCFAHVNVRGLCVIVVIVLYSNKVSVDSDRKSQRIAMRSKRALETVHDVKSRIEQTWPIKECWEA